MEKRPAVRSSRTKVQAVKRLDQIEPLRSPVRQDIVDTLEALGGEADIAAVAAELGRPADGLYYHFDLLAAAGLLQRIDADGGARRYRVGRGSAKRLRLDYRVDAAGRAAIGRVVDRVLKTAARDFHAAFADASTVVDGARRELWAGRSKGWVSRAELAEINRLLKRIQDLLQGPRREARDRLVSVSFVLAPLPARATRRDSD